MPARLKFLMKIINDLDQGRESDNKRSGTYLKIGVYKIK